MYVCLLIICLWYISKLFKTNILYRIDTGVILRLLLFAPLLLLQYGSAAVSFIAAAQTDSRHRGLTELLRPLCPTATLLLQNVSQGKVWKPPGTASDLLSDLISCTLSAATSAGSVVITMVGGENSGRLWVRSRLVLFLLSSIFESSWKKCRLKLSSSVIVL